MINENVKHLGNENWRGKPKYYEKTCPTATLSTINPTQYDLGSNQCHLGSQRLSALKHGPIFYPTSFLRGLFIDALGNRENLRRTT
jgi:hypothetical protein